MADFTIEEVVDLESSWPDLTTLFLELHAYHEPWTPRRLRFDWQQRWHDYVSQSEDRLILVARTDMTPVGYLNAGVHRGFGLFDEVFGFIDDAFVREGSRGGGVGAAMLQHAEDWMSGHGAAEVRLSVVAQNVLGHDFWTKRGFEVQSHTMAKALGEDEI